MQQHYGIVRFFKYILSFFLVLGALFVAGHGATAYAEGDRVYYFNMDSNGLQGSMILVESDGHWGLLDAGHRYEKTIQDENGKTYSTKVNGLSSQINCRNGKDVANYMTNVLGVTHLDFIVGTHAHSDHVGGIPELVATTFYDEQGNTRFLVDENTTYYYKEYQHISNLEDDLEKYSSSSWHNQAFAYQAENAMQVAGAKLIDLSKLDAFSDLPEGLTFVQRGELGDEYGDSLEFTVGGITFRLYNLYEHTDTANENVNSIVAVLSNGEYTVVNLADINTNHGAIDKISQAISEAFGTVDIVVAGHHGYAGSNTKEMFDQLQPEFVIVSNGSSPTSWFYTTGDLAAAIPYANERYGTDFYSTQISYYATVTDLSGNAVHIYSVNNTGDLADAMDRVLKVNGKKTGWVSWVNTDATLWSYLEKGRSVKDNWRQVGGKWYHFDEYGIMQTGWITANENEYFLNDSGAAVSGWKERDGEWYYLNPNKNGFGKVMTGWQNIGGKKYFFADDGIMQKNLWKDDFYLSDSGAMATGWQTIDGERYYFDPNTKNKSFGRKLLGWQTIGKRRYYFDDNGCMVDSTWVDGCYLKPDGAMAAGWQEINGSWYYLNPDSKARGYGRIMTGWRTIGGQKYYFNDEGVMLHGVWQDDFYLTDNGSVAAGWQTIDGKKFYFDPNTKNKTFGRKLYGWKNIGGKNYYLDGDDGHMVSGTWVDGCYLKDDGIMATGWLELNGSWYYLNPDSKARGYGRIMTGWQKIGGKNYFFNDEGVMLHDIWQDGFYLGSDGVRAIGLVETADGTFYLDPNTKNRSYGKPLTGWQRINNRWYFFGDDGRMVADAWVDGCYLTADGTMATGLQVIDGYIYYLNSKGEKQTGWQIVNGKKYFFDADGRAATGTWTSDGVYLTEEGPMATGIQTIDGVIYYLDANGHAQGGWHEGYYFDTDGILVTNTWVDGRYVTADGSVATGIQTIDGVTYYLDAGGHAQGGWHEGYYFSGDGTLVTNAWTPDGYYVIDDGTMASSGWRQIGDAWYYFHEDGSMATGWLYLDSGTYYLASDGVMAVGEQEIDGVMYYFNTDGSLYVVPEEGGNDNNEAA